MARAVGVAFCTNTVRLPIFDALVAVPVRLAVIVPAEKLPEASRATIADAVFALAAVVAEFETLPAVEMVASFVSTIAAAELMSTFMMVSLAILSEVTEPVVNSASVIAVIHETRNTLDAVLVTDIRAYLVVRLRREPSELSVTPASAIKVSVPVPPWTISTVSPTAIPREAGKVTPTGVALFVKSKSLPASDESTVYVDADMVDKG